MEPFDIFIAVLLGLIAKDIIYIILKILGNGAQEIWKLISK
jgi:hypothetical protein